MDRRRTLEAKEEFAALMRIAQIHAADPANLLIRHQLAMSALCFAAVYNGPAGMKEKRE